MGFRLNTLVEYQDIPHPTIKGVSVKCKKLEPVEAMDLFSGFQQYQRIIVLTNPTTGEILKDDKGNIQTQTLTNLPASALIDILDQVIESVTGLEDQDGKVIDFGKKENLKYLFKPALNVDGKSYADYIQAELNKELNTQLEEAEKAPKEKTSPKRA